MTGEMRSQSISPREVLNSAALITQLDTSPQRALARYPYGCFTDAGRNAYQAKTLENTENAAVVKAVLGKFIAMRGEQDRSPPYVFAISLMVQIGDKYPLLGKRAEHVSTAVTSSAPVEAKVDVAAKASNEPEVSTAPIPFSDRPRRLSRLETQEQADEFALKLIAQLAVLEKCTKNEEAVIIAARKIRLVFRKYPQLESTVMQAIMDLKSDGQKLTDKWPNLLPELHKRKPEMRRDELQLAADLMALEKAYVDSGSHPDQLGAGQVDIELHEGAAVSPELPATSVSQPQLKVNGRAGGIKVSANASPPLTQTIPREGDQTSIEWAMRLLDRLKEQPTYTKRG